jgi:transcriptional regulator with XRE-family HTH domain
LVDALIAAVGRLVVEAREEKGWSQLQFSKEAGIFLEPLRLLEAGEEWMSEESMEVVEEALGWFVGVTSDIRHNSEYTDIPSISLGWVKDWSLLPQPDSPSVPWSKTEGTWGSTSDPWRVVE